MKRDLFVTWMEEGVLNVPHLLLKYFKKLQLNEIELVLMLQLYAFVEKGNPFPTPKELAERLTIGEAECANILRKCIHQRLIRIEEVENNEGIVSERYTLTPLWTELAKVLEEDERKVDSNNALELEAKLYQSFEKEFGRPLSPIETETLSMWLDQDGQTTEVILAALKEAVISSKLNFRYIDRILFEWKKNGIKNEREAKTFSQQFRQGHKKETQSKKSSKSIPLYNWLE